MISQYPSRRKGGGKGGSLSGDDGRTLGSKGPGRLPLRLPLPPAAAEGAAASLSSEAALMILIQRIDSVTRKRVDHLIIAWISAVSKKTRTIRFEDIRKQFSQSLDRRHGPVVIKEVVVDPGKEE